jgi:hypothetical protein
VQQLDFSLQKRTALFEELTPFFLLTVLVLFYVDIAIFEGGLADYRQSIKFIARQV